MRLHMQKILRWSDQPDAIVGLHPFINHVHHGDGATKILHVTATIGNRLNGLIQRVTNYERVESLVAQSGPSIGVESYQ